MVKGAIIIAIRIYPSIIKEKEMKTIKQSKLSEYERILNDFILEEELAPNHASIESTCKIGFKKLRLAKNFAQIDDDILNLSLEAAISTGGFFTDLLYLEAKRLRFKEEALKCIEKTKSRTKIRT